MSATTLEYDEQIYQFFIEESLEFLQILESGLLDLRHDHSVPKIHELMRAAHSIKGGAASMGLNAIKAIAHQLEDVFRALYRLETPIESDFESLLLKAYDCLSQPLLEQIQTGHHDGDAALKAAKPILDQLADWLGNVLQDVDHELPTSAELGFDLVAIIFGTDVAQGIERLKNVLANPDDRLVLGEIHAQAEVFVGVGQLVNVPGFVSIAQATIAALDAQPDAALEIGAIALEEFKTSQAGVLDKTALDGGAPSEVLLQFAEPGLVLDIPAESPPAPFLECPQGLYSGGEDYWIGLNQSAENAGFGSEAILPTSEFDIENIFGMIRQEVADSNLDTIFIAAHPETPALKLDDSFSFNPQPIGEMDLDSIFKSNPSIVTDLDLNSIFSGEPLEIPNSDLNDIFSRSPIAQILEIQPEFQPVVESVVESVVEPVDQIVIEPIAQAVVEPESQPVISEITSIITRRPTPKAAGTLAKPSGTGIASNTIKVDLPRLERLNNQIGELITQENGAILQVKQLQGLVGRLTDRMSRFETTTKGLQDFTDKSQNDRVRLQLMQFPMGMETLLPLDSTTEAVSFGIDQPELDPLQMDSYSELHLLVQSVIEEMAQFGEGLRDMSLIMQQAQHTQHQKQQTLKQVRNDLLWVRMFPLGDTLQRFPRMVRDLSTEYHKQVTVTLSGTNTLVDKAILDKLNDPLLHLVRNAFDHGVEPPADRLAQGKPSEATIEIRAYYRGNQTYIEVRDDGRGIDLEKIKAKAVSKKLISSAEAESLSSEQIQDFLFAPGFSTAAQVTELSGRGVGLDTVRSQIRLLKGGITIQSELGKGTTFTMRLPLTLTVAKLLVCSIGSNLLALPMDSLVSIVSITPDDITKLNGNAYYKIQDQLIPVYPKAQFLNHYKIPRNISDHLQSLAMPESGKFPLLLIAGESDIMALPVDQILQEQELVIKPFGSTIQPPPYLYGCTILGDGSLVPVLDTTALITPDRSTSSRTASNPTPPVVGNQSSDRIPSILVVDDSLTARSTLCATLKKAGYNTLQARDGREALTQLTQHPEIQAVFCDVEMPNMNGFEFLTHCRPDRPKETLPIIMVTSRSGDKHRQIAQALGATSYLTKPFLEQDLIKTLKTALGIRL
jgi:two-component system, chemotaxis family, sensor histidine kinase and response regulator PixL